MATPRHPIVTIKVQVPDYGIASAITEHQPALLKAIESIETGSEHKAYVVKGVSVS